MSLIRKLSQHWRRGTLVERVLERAGALPRHAKVHWHGASSPRQAALALARWGEIFVAGQPAGAWIACLGDGGEFHQQLNQALARRDVAFRSTTLEEARAWPADGPRPCGIVCGYADVRRITDCARALAAHPHLAGVPFEYAAGINPEKAQFARQDEYGDTWFVAPGLLDAPTPYELYAESLRRFEQKCGLRDYLDLYQALRHAVENQVPGDVAEFGSYKGHSGWLIARTLQALGSDKRVYLFDTFEEFPPEPFGVDHFWNRSHHVDFAEVSGKLAGMPNVTLVKGDFTQTLAASGIGPLALAYIDCDSYRATRYLIDRLWARHLHAGAILVCEDYGHPALLGNRAAVHEELDGRRGAFRFFSQFSGLYIALKTA